MLGYEVYICRQANTCSADCSIGEHRAAKLAQEKARKPDWLKRTVPGGDKYVDIKAKLRELKLNTVCEEVSPAAV